MHAARFDRSPRLQRVHALLADGLPRSTLDIARDAQVCAAADQLAPFVHPDDVDSLADGIADAIKAAHDEA